MAKGVITPAGISNDTKKNPLWKPEKINFKFQGNRKKTHRKIIMRKISFCEKHFCSLFSWAPIRTFSLKLFHITDYINFIGLKKCKKECNMLEIILVQA